MPFDQHASLSSVVRPSDGLRAHDPDEEELTNELLVSGYPEIRYAQLSRQQESVLGGDWLWWFVDESGECFGIIVQAKRARHNNGKTRLDLGFSPHARNQMRELFDSSDILGVPAAYVLYLGALEHDREYGRCTADCRDDCDKWSRSAVSAIGALEANLVRLDNSISDHNLVEDLHRYSLPLEDLACDSASERIISDLNRRYIAQDNPLYDFLASPQEGSRAVAKRVFAIVSDMRQRQFRLAAGAQRTTSEIFGHDRIFADLPTDTGHFGRPYFEHVLRGLRRTLPRYVYDAMSHTVTDLPVPLSGIAVIYL